MESNTNVLDEIRSLVAPLSAEERLVVIRTIAIMEPGDKASAVSPAERRSQLTAEQATWYARPHSERQRYQGEFVAVRDGQVVDHDPDQRSLYLRARARFGHAPVLIVHADWTEPPVYTIHSPRLEMR
jgi:hypothetical protein